jgi:cytochrome c oxidase subunit II
MTDHEHNSRRERRAIERESSKDLAGARGLARPTGHRRGAYEATVRKGAFGAIVLVVLGIGGVLAFGDFVGRPGDAAGQGSIDIQSSMAGFTPSEIRVKAGETTTMHWWTDDAAVHLQGGVHTMVSPELALYEELPAEGDRTIVWTVPDKPGTYDVWCESCCGGKESPAMHGTIVVEPASAADLVGRTLG